MGSPMTPKFTPFPSIGGAKNLKNTNKIGFSTF